MALIPVSNLVATASDSDTIGLAWTNPDIYTSIRVQYNKGAGWTNIALLDGSDTSYNEDDIVPNILYNFRLSLFTEEDSGFSNTDSAVCWADALTDEIKASEVVTDYATGSDVSDTVTDTMYVSDFIIDAKDIITNYAYYVATADGKIYEYSGFYKSDAGTAITARWESKDTDFADQNIEWADRFKTVEKVRLHFIDKSAGAQISIRVSIDGGANWTTKTRNIGTGDTKGKTADFFLIKTGQIFRFAIENASASDDFQFVGLEVFYNVGGDFFEI